MLQDLNQWVLTLEASWFDGTLPSEGTIGEITMKTLVE